MTECSEIVKALQSRYKELHPLLFKRSFEYAKDITELFDILETMPKEYPINWNEEKRCWENFIHY